MKVFIFIRFSGGDIKGSLLSSCVVLRCRWRRRHKIISVTFFSGTTEANFLIFGTEYQYGELYRVTQFWICGHRQICSQDNFCHIFLGNHTSQFLDIWHRALVWRTVSYNTVLNMRHVHFLFDATLNILKKRNRQATHVFPGRLTTKLCRSYD